MTFNVRRPSVGNVMHFHSYREPILQPPKPEIPPSLRILERVIDCDADWAAAD